MKIRSVFPFQLFPDYVILDNQKLTYIQRSLGIKHVITVQLPDLLNVEIIAGPFFASAKVYSKYVTGGHFDIKWLWKQDAYKLRDRANELKAETDNNDTSGGQ